MPGFRFPFVLRSLGRDGWTSVPLPGFPLGMFAGVGLESYEVRSLNMMPGDVLVVASDGLRETQTDSGEFFGDRTSV